MLFPDGSLSRTFLGQIDDLVWSAVCGGWVAADHTPDGRSHQPADEVFEHRLRHRWEQNVPGPEVEEHRRPNGSIGIGELRVADGKNGDIWTEAVGIGDEGEGLGVIGGGVDFDDEHPRPGLTGQSQGIDGPAWRPDEPFALSGQLGKLPTDPPNRFQNDQLRITHGQTRPGVGRRLRL